MEKELYEKLLDKALTWVQNSCEDICQICAYYDKEEQLEDEIDYYLDNGIDPCRYRREDKCACKIGIAKAFLNQIKAEG